MTRELTKSDLHTLQWMTLREVASVLCITLDSARQLIDGGCIASSPVAGSGERRVHMNEVDRVLKERRAA